MSGEIQKVDQDEPPCFSRLWHDEEDVGAESREED
jgi:hypothetical protein